jgi:hypothetical protein
MFEHTGRWATLEDGFDPQRTPDDYFPTGFKSYSAKRDVLKVHPFESFERRPWPRQRYNDSAGRNGKRHCGDATMLRDSPVGSSRR